MQTPAPPARARLGRGRVAARARASLRTAFAILTGAWLTAGCSSMPPLASPAIDPEAASSTIVYVARRRWHIDIGFAAGELQGPLAQAAGQLPPAQYVFFGFGDRHYLLAKDRDAPVHLAALWPGAGLILVTTLMSSPQQAFGAGAVIELRLTSAQARAVQGFVARSLSRGRDGSVMPHTAGPYEGSAYFAAVPRYSALHTCITWAAEALRAGGVPVRARLTIVAGQLWGQLRKLRPLDAPPAPGLAVKR